MKSEITLAESRRFVACEKVIKENEQSFLKLGAALREIRDGKLYRADYGTFEECCQDKWGWGRQRAFQLISAAEIVSELPEKCKPEVYNEKTARELGKVPPPKREAVVKEIIEAGEPVTAKTVKAHSPPPPPPAPPAPPAKAPVPVKAPKPPIKMLYCKTGCEIPSKLWPLWERRDEVADELKQLGAWKKKYKDLQGEEYLILKDGIAQQIFCDLKHAQDLIETAQPYAVCNICMGGPQQTGCNQCSKTGFISKHIWDTVIDETVKKQRAKAIELKAAKK